MPKLTNDLLIRAQEAAEDHAFWADKLTEAMNDRYGCTHSDVDCDWLIDLLDYGYGGGFVTLEKCDEEMAKCGAYPLQKKEQAK